jgi:hypothetical protein
VWEINTTPSIVHPAGIHDTVPQHVHQRFAEMFSAALDAIEIGAA